jgi:hypothetical protein
MSKSLSETLLELTSNPDIIGELLRGKFFNQDNGKLGCYSTFELNNGVVKLPDGFDEESELKTTRAKMDDVEMEYFWDGDGELTFYLSHFPNQKVLINSDCKKSHGWKLLN